MPTPYASKPISALHPSDTVAPVTHFLEIPIDRLAVDVLDALLEEFASRDGTDYGEIETPIESRVSQLRRQLELGDLVLLYDSDNQEWDLLPKDRATEFLTQQY